MQSIRSDRSSTKYLGNQGQADAMMEMSERGGLCITVLSILKRLDTNKNTNTYLCMEEFAASIHKRYSFRA